MKHKQILALLLAVMICLSMAVTASAAGTSRQLKAADFPDFNANAWYAEAVSAAVSNGLLFGTNKGVLNLQGNLTRAEMAAVINRAFGCYKAASISQFTDVSSTKWYYKDIELAYQMGTYYGTDRATMTPDRPITREEIMTVVARALQLDLDAYSKTDLSKFADAGKVSTWALPYVRAMVGAGYIVGRPSGLAPTDYITRAEFAQVFANIIQTYITAKGELSKDYKGNLLVRCADVVLKDMTIEGDLIIGNGAADGKITLSNVTVKGRMVVWGGGTKAVYCNDGTDISKLIVCRVDNAVKVIFDRDSTLMVYDKIDVTITDRAKTFPETEVIFYGIEGILAAQKELNQIVTDNQLDVTIPSHLYALVGDTNVKAAMTNNSKTDTYKIEIRRNIDNALLADSFELAAGKSISALTLLEAPTYGDVPCIATITAMRDGKAVGSMQTELTLHAAYLWPKEVLE